MKDLLLFVPVDYFALAQFEYIPTGPLYLASFISEAGYDVDVLHGTVDEIKAGYKFYGISVTTATYSVGVAALKRIREIQPEAIVITGGPHYNAQLCIDLSLKDDWNFIVVGDGENGLLDIMNGKASASSRVVNGVEIEDLDSLPMPAFDKIDIMKYNYPLRDGIRCINMLTSRGCPFRCQFCSTSKRKLRQRSPENVIKEVDILTKKYGFNGIMFADETMSLNLGRYHGIMKELESYNIKWRSLVRTNAIPHTSLENMRRSGCIEAGPGIESGNQSILNMMRKGTKVKDNIAWVRACEEAGIRCTPSVIIGLPGETPDTIKDTYEFFKLSKPTAFAYNIFMPFPDSPIYQNYESFYKKYITIYPYEWDDCICKAKKITKCFVSTPELSREKILEEYYKYYDIFADMTGFDPRKRGNRK
jgi:anaerobic magnesium-protoporphyrin IX monomethyl ester cyclase